MEELSKAFEEAGLPGGFHEAAAEIYSRLSEYKDVAPEVAPAGVETAHALLRRGRAASAARL